MTQDAQAHGGPSLLPLILFWGLIYSPSERQFHYLLVVFGYELSSVGVVTYRSQVFITPLNKR